VTPLLTKIGPGGEWLGFETMTAISAVAVALAVGDVNRDGHVDLAAGLEGRVEVRLGAGLFNQVFRDPETDTNGDGVSDFAQATRSSTIRRSSSFIAAPRRSARSKSRKVRISRTPPSRSMS
jgi:hypothetical protein